MTANKQRPLNLRLRSAVIGWTAGALNWIHANIKTTSVQIGWPDRLRWFLEGQLQRIFALAYAGSDEELRAVFESEIPVRHMSERQRAILLNQVHSDHPTHCPACGWSGEWIDSHLGLDCPSCANPIYLDPFEPEERGT